MGHCPLFRPFMVSLRNILVLVGVSFSMQKYYNEHMMRLSVYCLQKLNLLPSWTQLVLTSLCHILWFCRSFKHCALPPSLLFHNCGSPANEKGLSFFEAEISYSVVFSDHLLWVFLLGHLFLKSSVSHYSLGSGKR